MSEGYRTVKKENNKYNKNNGIRTPVKLKCGCLIS